MTIPFLENIDALDNQPKHVLTHAPWKDYPYHPKVSFSIAHGTGVIYLQYHVEEKAIRAVNSTPNSPVWEDSCVEFFIAFSTDTAYYNLEFNCIGTGLIGYGEGKTDRKILPDEVVQQVKYRAVIANHGWQLTLEIPFSVFTHHQITSLNDKTARANFYKCGDLLPDPHFIAWSNIEWPEPNFHLSQFFSPVIFKS